MEVSILDEIGIRYNTDKSSIHHDYLRKYEKYLPFQRDDALKILEIGVLGGSSVRMWCDYFYNSQIIGIDINSSCKKHEDTRISIEIGSQVDPEFLKMCAEKHGPFDLIIDDGSHMNDHVIFSFEHLFGHLKSGGIYIVEDSVTSYWDEYGGSYDGEDTMLHYFKSTINEINFYGERLNNGPSGARRDENLIQQIKQRGIDKVGLDIESLNFLNSIILITKR